MTPPARPYSDARATIQDGDVLLFRGARGFVGRAIRWATRSRYSHVALAAWADLRGERRLFVLESRELRGCRMVPLSTAVAGAIVDVYSPREPLDRDAVIRTATARLGSPYGWPAIASDAIGRLPLLALLSSLGLLRKVPVLGALLARIPFGHAYSEDDLEDPGARVKCSTFVSLAYRAGGLDLVPNLADRSTDPGDIARSAALLPGWELRP